MNKNLYNFLKTGIFSLLVTCLGLFANELYKNHQNDIVEREYRQMLLDEEEAKMWAERNAKIAKLVGKRRAYDEMVNSWIKGLKYNQSITVPRGFYEGLEFKVNKVDSKVHLEGEFDLVLNWEKAFHMFSQSEVEPVTTPILSGYGTSLYNRSR